MQKNLSEMNYGRFHRNWKSSGSHGLQHSPFGIVCSLISFSLGIFFIISFYSLLTSDRFLALDNSVSWFPFSLLPQFFWLGCQQPVPRPSHTFPVTDLLIICLYFFSFLVPIVDATWSHLVPVTVPTTCAWINLILKAILWGMWNYSHFTDDEIRVQRRLKNFPKFL